MGLCSNGGLDEFEGDVEDVRLFRGYCDMVLERFKAESMPDQETWECTTRSRACFAI